MSVPEAFPRAENPRGKPNIGFLRRTRFKTVPRWAFRQITGLQSFHPVVLTRRKTTVNPAPSVSVVRLKKRNGILRTVYQKYILRAPPIVYQGFARALRDAVKKFQLRLLHVFYGNEAVKYLPCLELLELPVTVSFHGWDLSDCLNVPEYSSHLSSLFRRINCFMVRSQFMKNKLLAAACPEGKIWINRAGVPLQRFEFLARDPGRRPGPAFIQVCRLTGKKGLLTSLQAFRAVSRVIPGARFSIAGEGPLRSELEKFIESEGLSGSVKLLGFLDEQALVAALHEADLFIHPSLTTDLGDEEGIPNALLEAMATGLPPIVTRHAGLPEVVAEGKTGWLVDENNSGQLAEKMLWAVRHPEALCEVGRQARRFIEQEYSLDTRMRMLDAKYREIIEEYGT